MALSVKMPFGQMSFSGLVQLICTSFALNSVRTAFLSSLTYTSLSDPYMLHALVVMSVIAASSFSVAAFAPARSLVQHALHWPPRLCSACITRGMGRRRLAMEATNFEEYKTKRASFEPSEPRVGPTAAQTAGSTTTWPNYCEFCASIPTIKGRDAEEDGALKLT